MPVNKSDTKNKNTNQTKKKPQKKAVQVSLSTARRLHLHGQGLTRSYEHSYRHSYKHLQKVVEDLGYVQIDTISVVERAHHHVLWSRLPRYRPEDLSSLMQKRKVFEFWAHAASYLPMKDYRFSLPLKKRFHERKAPLWSRRDRQLMSKVLKVIRDEGPKRSRDFESSQSHKGGWWQWKPAKVALERLFLIGEIEVSERQGFQKIFDLTERVIPSNVDQRFPEEDEYADYLIEGALARMGLANFSEITYLLNGKFKSLVKRRLEQKNLAGELLAVQVESLSEVYYAKEKTLNRKVELSKDPRILSPFDSAVIQRRRLKDFFNFDFQIECYLPESKRKYGYFSLPVLEGEKFIGRIDSKAIRARSELQIKNVFAEPRCVSRMKSKELRNHIKEFALFNSCSKVVGSLFP